MASLHDKGPSRRRLNIDEPPFDQLPAVVANDKGEIVLVRGEFDLARLTRNEMAYIRNEPGVRAAVFANRLGGHVILFEGFLVPIGYDWTRASDLPFLPRAPELTDEQSLSAYANTLDGWAAQIRVIADRLREMEADGWELYGGDPPGGVMDLYDRSPGPPFAPQPRKRRRSTSADE